MSENLINRIVEVIHKAQEEPKTREMSLVITKLEEAGMWCRQHNHLSERKKTASISKESPNEALV